MERSEIIRRQIEKLEKKLPNLYAKLLKTNDDEWPSCPLHGKESVGFACGPEDSVNARDGRGADIYYCRHGWDLRTDGGPAPKKQKCSWEIVIPWDH
jgi:hypothetical protein